MIKKMSIRKIMVTTLSLIIIGLIYFFPTPNDELQIEKSINYYDEKDLKYVYLMDKYDYVSKLKLPIYETQLEEIVKEKLSYLIKGSNKENLLPSGIRAIVPSETKILNVSFDKNIVVINFSKELNNINSSDEESMIEAIVFTLTEIDEIDKVKILVDGQLLKELPNSKKKLPELLNRNFGINKVYEFDSLKDITSTIVYYVNEINDNVYYTPVTLVNNDERDKVTIIIEELKSSIIFQSNLSSYLAASTKLNDYEIVEDSIILSFNDSIFDTNSKNIMQEVEYTISMSLMDNLDVNEVVYEVNNEKILVTMGKTLE